MVTDIGDKNAGDQCWRQNKILGIFWRWPPMLAKKQIIATNIFVSNITVPKITVTMIYFFLLVSGAMAKNAQNLIL